jgi:hypothetical protein
MSRPLPLFRRPALHLVPLSLLSLLGCGGLSDGDVPPADALLLDINGERGMDHVRESLLITVQTTGATPDKVELLNEGTPFATLLPPFQYTFDAMSRKEGSYRLTARAEWRGRTFQSPAHTVVVDRTPPKVERTWPVGNNVSVKAGRELQVTFTEPMLASSFRADQVKHSSLYFGGTLSEDGRVLTVANGSTLIGEQEATLNLEGPTDLAGNALFQQGGEKTLRWTWSLPKFWEDSASRVPKGEHIVIDGVALALGADGSPLVAYSAVVPSPSDDVRGGWGESFVVMRWSPSGWSMVGAPQLAPTATPAAKVRHPLLVMGRDGHPVAAFIQGFKDKAQDSLHVTRWDGSAWKPLGQQVMAPEGTKVHGAALAVDREDRPVVAWSGVDGIHVARWELDRWVTVGDVQRATLVGEGSLATDAPALAVDADNRFVVAWAESEPSDGADLYVRRWNGTAWEPLGARIEGHTLANMGVRFPSLLIRPDNQPTVSWSVQCQTCSSRSAPVYTATWSGTAWGKSPLSSSESSAVSRGTAVALDSRGRTLHAWTGGSQDSFGTSLYASWYPYSDYPSVERLLPYGSPGRLSMVVDARDQPVLAWQSGSTASVLRKNE